MKENNEKKYALILAGGKGSRLWPISTTNKPKQYLNLYSDNIMINETIKRIEGIFEYDNIFVITSLEQKELAERYIDYKIPRENIIYEPMTKNTAMCIFYASVLIKEKMGDGIITILSSDHYINPKETFIENINEGIKIARCDKNLVTIGIKPTYPATGFGYIKYHKNVQTNLNDVEEFKEKPSYETAKEYCKSGEYYWNSGMFIWSIKTILDIFKMYLPDIYKYKNILENNINNYQVINGVYKNVLSISIDKGILEKSKNIKMIESKFEWSDIGSINDWFKLKEKNNEKALNVIGLNNENVSAYNAEDEKLLVTLGANNLNIINCNDVILVANKDRMNELPEIIKIIKQNKEYEKYL